MKLISFLFGILFSPILFADTTQDFTAWLEKGMARNHIPGMSIVVVENYNIVFAHGFGFADIENAKPVTPDVIFQAGSISKPVTAMAALKTVQDGKITLDEDINTVLTSWKIPESKYTQKNKVTLKGLLSHSAGISVSGFVGYENGKPLPTLVEVLNGTPPANSKPVIVESAIGKKWNYSGGGYTIVQQALIDIYHTSFTDLMYQLVLNPLNMSASTFAQPMPASLKGKIALPYRPDGKMLPGGPNTYIEQAAAGLWTTPGDLSKYVGSIQKSLQGDTNQVLSKHYAELLAVIPQSRAPNVTMGLGALVSVGKYGKVIKNGKYFMHSGQNEGYRNLMIGDTQKGNSIIIMTNMSAPENEVDHGWEFIMAVEKKLADMYKWQ